MIYKNLYSKYQGSKLFYNLGKVLVSRQLVEISVNKPEIGKMCVLKSSDLALWFFLIYLIAQTHLDILLHCFFSEMSIMDSEYHIIQKYVKTIYLM